MLNQMVKVTAYLLALLLFSFVFCVHLPNYLNTGDAEYRQLAFLNILKDTALAAFALYIASNARHQKVLEETVRSRKRQKNLIRRTTGSRIPFWQKSNSDVQTVPTHRDGSFMKH
jgi:hypothetical protein